MSEYQRLCREARSILLRFQGGGVASARAINPASPTNEHDYYATTVPSDAKSWRWSVHLVLKRLGLKKASILSYRLIPPAKSAGCSWREVAARTAIELTAAKGGVWTTITEEEAQDIFHEVLPKFVGEIRRRGLNDDEEEDAA